MNKYNNVKSSEAQKERKVMNSVVKSEIKLGKKSLGRKILETFVAADVVDVKEYIIQDVIIPSIRNAIYDTITNSASMMCYGDSRATSKNKWNGGYVTYSSASKKNKHPAISNNRSIGFDLTAGPMSKEEAMDAFNDMRETIEDYEWVSVSQYKQLIGKRELIVPQDENYGWNDLRNLNIRPGRDGWYIDPPKPIPEPE